MWESDSPASRQGTALYGLRPRALHQPQQESLRGYLLRLAVEHCVRPRELVAQVIAPLEPAISKWTYASFFSRHGLTMDGVGLYAKTFARVLELATGQPELATLTLLRWSTLLPPNGKALLARQPRWCPACLADGVRSPEGAHWQLRWSLDAITHCTDHLVALIDRCGHCGRRQPAVPRHPLIGWCDHCLSPLFSSPKPGEAPEPVNGGEQRERASFVDDLVSMQGRLEHDPMDQWARFLEQVVDRLGEGERAAACRRMGLQPRAFNAWLRRKDRVSLDAVLRVCTSLGFTAQAVFGDATRSPAGPVTRRAGRPLVRHGRDTREHAAGLLAKAADLEDPPSLRQVAAAAGVSRGYLTYWFRAQARTVTGRRRERVAQVREQRVQQQMEFVKAAVLKLVDLGVFPGRKLVELAVRGHGFSLMDDGMLEAYRSAVRAYVGEGA